MHAGQLNAVTRAEAGAATRRELLKRLALLPALFGAPQAAAAAGRPAGSAVADKPVPGSGERIPVVGLGSWITFNVGNDPIAREACADVMRAFFDAGGRMIDSSPMYG
ncbi:MAG: aldo/keto reductase, partial [Rhizobacter sp.]|nr:aldo/keto reductase [Rhizobacter sp.]